MTQHLSPLDAAFLELEDSEPNVSLAIAAIAILEGPAPAEDEFLDSVANRMFAVPHARERVHTTALDLSAPTWIDDTNFDLGHHLRRTALPAPGDDDALSRLVGRVMTQRLDRSRPMWECWVIEGLEHDRWAIMTKIHHCMADGISGSRLLEALCDPEPDSDAVRLVARPVAADDRPGITRRVRDTIAAIPTSPEAQFHSVMQGLLTPVHVALATFHAAKGFAGIAGGMLSPTTSTSLLGEVGKQRRYAMARASMHEIREVCSAFDVKVNDVALAAITGALRELLLRRGEEPKEDAIRTLVPVSVRSAGAAEVLDNRVSLMLPVLPVAVAEPLDQLAAVHERMAAHKSGGEAQAGHLATSLAEHTPFAPTAWAVRLAGRLPQYGIDIVSTNVPGPKHEKTVLGRRVVEIFPFVPIAWRLRIGIAILSYADRVSFGITGDFDSAPDIDFLAREIERHVAVLVEAAHSRV